MRVHLGFEVHAERATEVDRFALLRRGFATFTLPSVFKAWLDQIVVDGRTFGHAGPSPAAEARRC